MHIQRIPNLCASASIFIVWFTWSVRAQDHVLLEKPKWCKYDVCVSFLGL